MTLKDVIDIDSVPIALAFCKRESKEILIEAANDKFCTLFGYSIGELNNTLLYQIVPEASRAKHEAAAQAYLNDANPKPLGVDRELQGLKKDGSVIPIEIGLYPISGGVLVVVIDILVRTAAKAMQEFKDSFNLLENLIKLKRK